MLDALQKIRLIVFLIIGTTLQAIGDAIVSMTVFEYVGIYRVALFLGGAALLFAYARFLHLSRLEFGQVIGLYFATLFVIWQIINLVFFRALPTIPILIGGVLVVAGAAIIAFWKRT